MNTICRTREGRQAIRAWCQARLSDWDHPHHARLVPTTVGPVHAVTAGNGPDLVLLPGTNFAAATWLDLIASLAARHAVHAVDLPGQPGLSATDRAAPATERQQSWLAGVLSTLDMDRPALVAHSLGAVAALHMAAAGLPTRRLVLIDPAGVMRLKVSLQVMRPKRCGSPPPRRRARDRRSRGVLLRAVRRGPTRSCTRLPVRDGPHARCPRINHADERTHDKGTIRYHARIDRPADEVWKEVADWGSISAWFPMITDSRIQDDSRRFLRLGNGATLEEELVTRDHDKRRFRYAIVAGDVSVESHLATIDVLEDGEGALAAGTLRPRNERPDVGPSAEVCRAAA